MGNEQLPRLGRSGGQYERDGIGGHTINLHVTPSEARVSPSGQLHTPWLQSPLHFKWQCVKL